MAGIKKSENWRFSLTLGRQFNAPAGDQPFSERVADNATRGINDPNCWRGRETLAELAHGADNRNQLGTAVGGIFELAHLGAFSE